MAFLLFLLFGTDFELKPVPDLAPSIQALEFWMDAQLPLTASGFEPVPRPEAGVLLDRLQSLLTQHAKDRVARIGSKLVELPITPEAFSEGRPILPPEQVRDGRWSFETQRFELKPKYLFICGLTFKPNRTVRIRRVTLVFQDGSATVHDPWSEMENGNGVAFSKRGYLPWLWVTEAEARGPAKRLAAIEILGSAQDGGFRAALDFLARVPDPAYDPGPPSLDLLSQIRRTLTKPSLSREDLASAADKLAELKEILGITTSVPAGAR